MKQSYLIAACRSLILLALISAPAVALGHPGHGVETESNGLIHYVLSPMHSLPALTVLATIVIVARRILKSGSPRDES